MLAGKMSGKLAGLPVVMLAEQRFTVKHDLSSA